MSGKLPIRVEFNRTFRQMQTQTHERGLDGVNARVVGGLTNAFVEKFERERSLRSHPPHAFHAIVGAVTNILVGLHRYFIDPGKQRETLDRVLGTIREQATERLDVVNADTPVFFPDGFDPRAGRRDSDAEYNQQRRRKRAENSDE